MNKITAVGISVLALALLAPTSARAASITYTAATQSGLTELGTIGSPTTWAFREFDPSLGTLQSVRLDIDASFLTDINVTNSGNESSNGDVQTRLRLFVQDGPNNLALGSPLLDMFSGDFDFSPLGVNQTVTSTQSGGDVFGQTYTAANVLAQFTGTASSFEDLFYYTITSTILGYSGGNVTAGQTTAAALNGSITYTYDPTQTPPLTPTPEPASLLLVGTGALGLLTRMRKMRRA
jgi:hypothetical protein